jgi:hypothetical protein
MMSTRISSVLTTVCTLAALMAGCSLFRSRTAVDFTDFRTAKKLWFGDRGLGSNANLDIKRSAEITDPHLIADATTLLETNAKGWKEVAFSQPALRFTLWAATEEGAAHWASFQPGYDASGAVYIQKDHYYTQISADTFQRLLMIFGARDWPATVPVATAARAGQGPNDQPPRR